MAWIFFLSGTEALWAAPTIPTSQAPVINSLTYSSEPIGADGKWKVYFYWTVSDPDSSVSSLLCQVDTNRLDETPTPEFKGPCALSGDANPDFTYTYPQGGTYSVSLTVQDKNGNRASKNLSISSATNTAPVIRSFSATPTSAASVPATISFTWDLYDANGDTLTCTVLPDLYTDSGKIVQSPCAWANTMTYTYSQSGTYAATLIVTDGKSPDVTSTVVVQAAVNQKPTVHSFTATPSSTTAVPGSSTFAWDIDDPNGDALKCTLVLNPYDREASTRVQDPCTPQSSASYTYAQLGTYQATLIVTDKQSEEVYSSATVEVGSGFTLTPSPTTVTIGQGESAKVRIAVAQANLLEPVHLSLSSGASGYLSGSLDPIDVEGDSSELTISAADGAAFGTYSMTISGTSSTSSGSLSRSAQISVTVADSTSPAIDDLLTTPNPVIVGHPTTFHWGCCNVVGESYACTLDPGDGHAAFQLPSCTSYAYDYVYSALGTYTAKLSVKDLTNGLSTTASVDTTVVDEGSGGTEENHPPAISSFVAEPASGTLEGGEFGTIFRFTATDPDGDAMLCTVSAGDGSTPVSGLSCAQPYGYTYKTAGTLTATVTATDMAGASGTATTSILVTAEETSNVSPKIDGFTATPAGGTLVNGELPVTFTWTATDGDSLSCTLDADAGLGPQPLEGVDCARGPYTYVYTRDEIEEELGGYTGEWSYTNTPKLVVYDSQGASAAAETTIEMTAPMIAPTVLAGDPVDGAKNLPTNTVIYLAFSDLMDPASTEGSFSLTNSSGTPISGEFTWLSGSELQFTPTSLLPDNANYTVTVLEDAANISGLSLASGFSVNFTTVSAPQVVETSPWHGKTYVGVKRPLRIAFDQVMDTASVETAFRMTSLDGDQVLGSFEWSSDNTVMKFTPTSPLALDTTYTVNISSGTSVDTGYTLAPYILTFTTSTEASDFGEMREALELIKTKLAELSYIETVDDLKALQAYIATLEAFGDSVIDEEHLCILATLKNGIEYTYCREPAPEEESQNAAAKTASAETESLPAASIPISTAVSSNTPETTSSTTSGSMNKVTTPSYTLPDSKTVYLGETYLGYQQSSPISDIKTWLQEKGYTPLVIDPTVETFRQMRNLPTKSIGGLYINGHSGYTMGSYVTSAGKENSYWVMSLQTNTPVPQTEEGLAPYQEELEEGILIIAPIAISWSESGEVTGISEYFYVTEDYGIPRYFKGRFANHSLIYINGCTSIELVDGFKEAAGDALFTFMGHTLPPDAYPANDAVRSFFSGMLGKEYRNPRVTEATYTPPARPFWVSGVMDNKMYGAANVDYVNDNVVLMEATQKSRALLRPTISSLSMDIDLDTYTTMIDIFGRFGTTDASQIHVYLDGVEIPLHSAYEPSLGSAADTVPAPYTTMAGYEILPDAREEDRIYVDLANGNPCGMLQVVVNGLESNEVPLTCWNGSANYEANISALYFYPEQGDVMSAGELLQAADCDFQISGDVHGYRRRSPWERPFGSTLITGENDESSSCTYTYSGSLVVLRELDGEGVCSPQKLEPGESCSTTTQERTYTFLTDGGAMPLVSTSAVSTYPSMTMDFGTLNTSSVMGIGWGIKGLEPGTRPFPALLNVEDKIRIDTTTYTTTYNCDENGEIHEETLSTVEPPLEQGVGFYFDDLYTNPLTTMGMQTPMIDFDIREIKKEDGVRDTVKYRVKIPAMGAVNAPTDQTAR